MVLRGMEFGDEVHLECASKLGRRAKGEVYVLAEHLGDVGTRDLHALREVGLGEPELLHAQKNLSQERRADVIDCLQERSWSSELELESGGGDFLSWSQELELESGVYFFINVVSIRLISAAKVSTSSIVSRYPSSFAISSCVIVSYSEPRAIERK